MPIVTKKAIENAIRSNQLEGLETSPEMRVLLDRVADGELTFDQVREIIDAKAKNYAQGKSFHELTGKEMEKVLVNIKNSK